jgi:adenylate kinase
MTKKLFDSYPPVPELIFVLGGPGSGKGTQCARIVNDYGFVHISAGDLLREEIQKGSKDGEMIAGMIREGQIVPHDVTIRLLRAALFKHHDKTKYLIDGFPRNVEQVKHFCEVVGKARMTLFFDAPDEVLTERLMERGKDSGRTDDNAEAIAKRLRVYHKQSVPVIKHLQKMDTASVHSINANRSADEVYADVERVLLWDKQQIVWVTGQPLSGKTQLCSRLKTTHGAEHLSFADLLKAEALSNSQTGKKIASYVRRGERVPAELVVQVVRAAVDRCNGGLILLDGFPRKQAEADLLFEAVGQPKFVVDLDTSAAGEPDAVSIERIKQFDADSDGMLSKEEFATAGYIGTMLERAESEGDAAIPDMMAKLNAFTDETAPVIDTFKKLGKVRTIDATQDFEEVVSKAALML